MSSKRAAIKYAREFTEESYRGQARAYVMQGDIETMACIYACENVHGYARSTAIPTGGAPVEPLYSR